MAISEQHIQCPQCGESISIDAVLTHQIEEKIKKTLEASHKKKEHALIQQAEALQKQTVLLQESEKNMQLLISNQVSEKLKTEKIKLFQAAKSEAEKEQYEIKSLLEEQLKSKDEKLTQATKNEVALRKQQIQLQEEKQAFELDKMRQLEEAKVAFIEEAEKKATEDQKYVVAQLKKQLTDAIKAKDDLARKLEQGSQKTQGEVLELELEDILRAEFPHDKILPVPTGVTGADIIQEVHDSAGRFCGKIAWETKKTKSWNENWIQKLKDDQRAIKADLAVIVSAALPDYVKGFIFHNGVWICDIKLITALAIALRMNLTTLAREKSMSVGKNEKMEILYSYLTGIEFKQRVEAIVEAFNSMDMALKKERIAVSCHNRRVSAFN